MFELIKILFLFLGIWLSIVNMVRTYKKINIPAINMALQAIGVTGFVYMQWLMT
jgi:hypothetical protein